MEEEKDYSAIQGPLNSAIKIIAEKEGRRWNREIIITTSISFREYHIGEKICRLNPKTVLKGNILEVVHKLFEMSDTLETQKETKKAEAIAFEVGQIKKKLAYLKRALHNGQYESLMQELREYSPPRRIPIPQQGRPPKKGEVFHSVALSKRYIRPIEELAP